MREITVIEPPSLSDLRPWRSLKRLVRFADLLRTLTAHRLNVRYKQSRLGVLWALIQPLAMMTVFTLMFNVLGRPPTDDVPYALFAFAGLVPWSAFAAGLSSGTTSLTGHATLLTKVYFPREILPITYVLVALVDLGLTTLALGALMLWFGVPISAAALWSVPAVALLALNLTGCSLLLAAVQVRHRDVGIAMPVLLQIWMFASPVIYPLDVVKASLPGWAYQVYVLNPLAGIVDTFRRGMVLQQGPAFDALGRSLMVTLVLLPIAYVYFKWLERTMADSI